MPRHFIKIKDHYFVWSTVVDAPIFSFKNKTQLINPGGKFNA